MNDNMTVGDLIDELLKFDQKLPIMFIDQSGGDRVFERLERIEETAKDAPYGYVDDEIYKKNGEKAVTMFFEF